MRDVFILGAGFSKAIDDRMLTLSDLSADVLRAIRHRDPKFGDHLKTRSDNNVELWMNYLFQDSPWLSVEDNYHKLSMAHYVRKELAAIISYRERSIRQPPHWATELVNHWHQRRAIVLSLNYDMLVERVAGTQMRDAGGEDWGIHPSDLYPTYFTYVGGRGGFARWGFPSHETFTLLKPHGSTNWYYSGQPDFHGESILYADVPVQGLAGAVTEEPRDKDVLIVPPITEKSSYFQNETINRLWWEAAEALRRADRVFVIGYSLPTTDLGMTAFLATTLRDTADAIYIVNPDPESRSACARCLDRTTSTTASRGRRKSSGSSSKPTRTTCDQPRRLGHEQRRYRVTQCSTIAGAGRL